MQDKIITALDIQTNEELDYLFDELSDDIKIVKIGMEAFYTFGNDIVKKFKEKNIKIFLDLKLHDIPTTVHKACKTLGNLEVDILNLHAAGGKEMMKAGLEGFLSSNPRGKLIGVTQLTSTNQEMMNNELNIQGSIEDQVKRMSLLVKEAGLHGIVSSAGEVKLVKEEIGSDFLCITPGIRPKGAHTDDQKRIYTPAEALSFGADYLVIGRPITKASSPKQAYLDIIKGL